MDRLDRLPSGRKLVEHGYVEISVQGHGQRAGNRRGGHHQHVRRDSCLRPEFRALLHAEAVLLVDDGQRQVFELYRVFNQGVRTHDDLQRTVEQATVDHVAVFLFRVARQQGDGGSRRGQEFPDAVVMLVGQHFRRRHHTGLITVVERHHGCQHGHQGFSAAHVSLQETVHLAPAAHVDADFLEHALLGAGQREGQAFIRLVEIGPYATEHDPAFSPHPNRFLPQQRELEIEQLLELETALGPAQILQ